MYSIKFSHPISYTFILPDHKKGSYFEYQAGGKEEEKKKKEREKKEGKEGKKRREL